MCDFQISQNEKCIDVLWNEKFQWSGASLTKLRLLMPNTCSSIMDCVCFIRMIHVEATKRGSFGHNHLYRSVLRISRYD